jgi:dTDP-4-amino-4,6-dideoxygalactose transaminase
MILFNKPYVTGKELQYIAEAMSSGRLSGNGDFTKRCQAYFESQYRCQKVLLTSSGTDALEMAAILANVGPGDEVIVPSFTFVSSALAFVRQGARIIFADSNERNPNISAESIHGLLSPKTKVIVPVHYAGVACAMSDIMRMADARNILVVEDAAQAIDSRYNGRPLGTLGHMSAFSFHETKNIHCGEGGMLVINDSRFVERAEIIWEKGTNRASFFRGEIDKYGWVDTGSSFLPSELSAAFLLAQLERISDIQTRRRAIWERYYKGFEYLAKQGVVLLPHIPDYASNNAHMFYLVCKSLEDRASLIAALKLAGVMAVFHYSSLHKSRYHQSRMPVSTLPHSDRYSDCLVRLPLYPSLTDLEVDFIIDSVNHFYRDAHV